MARNLRNFGQEYIGTRGSTPIKGLRNVLLRINREVLQIEQRTLKGLIKAVALVYNETEQGSIKVPVDTGNLRHSWFTVTSSGKVVSGGGRTRTVVGGSAMFKGSNASVMAANHAAMLREMRMRAWSLSKTNDGPFIFFGYTANYATYVHEMIDVGPWDPVTKRGFKRPGSGSKWFEAALRKHQDNIITIIKENARF